MELLIGGAGLVVALVAVGISVWQGQMSKSQLKMSEQQLDLARESEDRTERALEEIRVLSRENRDLASGVKSDIDGRINKFLDQQLDRMKQEANAKARDDEMSSQFAQKFMGDILGGGLGLADDGDAGGNQ